MSNNKLKFLQRIPLTRSLAIVFLVLGVLLLALVLTFFPSEQLHQAQQSQNTQQPQEPPVTEPPRTPLPEDSAIIFDRLELVTNDAFGDGTTYVPNGWGIHKNRIVRTNSGDIFVVYLAAGSDMTNRQWRLMHRAPDGTWTQINQGDAGVEPINILRGPNDDLNLFAWPGTSGTLQYIHSTDLGKTFTTTSIPGQWTTDQGYSGAGINDDGDMVIFQSGNDKPGSFNWAYYTPSSNSWHFDTNTFDYRYTYAFFLPGNNNNLTIVGMRDVLRSELGYPSSNGFNYIFNAIKYFQLNDVHNPQQLYQLNVTQAQPKNNSDSNITYLSDVYIDTLGRTHILYNNMYDGPHHTIIENSMVIKDVRQNISYGKKTRIVQDTTGRFYIIATDNNSLHVYPGAAGDTDGTQLDPVVSLNISNYPTCHDDDFCMSPTLTVPRNGHALQNYVDGVYGYFNKVFYFRLQLRNDAPVTLTPAHPLPPQPNLFTALLEGYILESGSRRRSSPIP